MDVSPDGELIASSFEGQRDIQLWHNLVYTRPWTQDAVQVTFRSMIKEDHRRQMYAVKNTPLEQDIEQKHTIEVEEVNHDLMQYTDLP